MKTLSNFNPLNIPLVVIATINNIFSQALDNARTFHSARKGAAGDSMLLIVYTAVVLIIGVFVYSSIYININTTALDTNAQATITTINTTAYAAFALIVISLIVIAAGAILRYTGLLGGGAR